MPQTTPEQVKWRGLGLFLGVSACLLVADQVTKYLAVQHLTYAFEAYDAQTFGQRLSAWLTTPHPPPKPWVTVVELFWNHRYVENPGAVWSFAGDWPKAVRVPFFHVATWVAVVFIAVYHRRTLPEQRLLRFALALLLGGALGNYADRLVHGYVIDFIDWHWNDAGWLKPELHFPTFNVADAGITSGVTLFLLDGVIAWWRERRQARSPVPPRPAH